MARLSPLKLGLPLLALLLCCPWIYAQSPGTLFIDQHARNVARNAINLYDHLSGTALDETGCPLDVTPESVALIMRFISAHPTERPLITASLQSRYAYYQLILANVGLREDAFPGVEPRRQAVWNFAERFAANNGHVLAPTWESADLVRRYVGSPVSTRGWFAAILGAYEEHYRLVQAVARQTRVVSQRLAVNPPPGYFIALVGRCAYGADEEACSELRLEQDRVALQALWMVSREGG